MDEHPVILFDGVCNFCNGAVNSIIKQDKKRIFRYATLQSEVGQELLKKYNFSVTELDSFVVIESGKAYKKTTAALHLYPRLGFFWKLLNILWILPVPVRDAGYNVIARNRYKWFGKKDSCMIPGPEVRSLFL